MEKRPSKKPSIGNVRRKVSPTGIESLVKTSFLAEESVLPLIIEPAIPDVDLVSWADKSRDFLKEQLLKYGGVLFRGFAVNNIAAFEQLARTIAQGPLLDYTYRSTPRDKVEGNVYTSTEYPQDQVIPQHNEMSYARSWPLKIWFYCVKAAEKGGETPLADSRKVYACLDPAIVQRFQQQQVMYVRNYGMGIDLPWQNVFQTTSRAEVEQFCRSTDMSYQWIGDDQLRTVQTCQAVVPHPQTGELLWFNQAHLFNIWSLPTNVRETLLSQFKEEDLPRNTYYGDGSPIEESVLAEISATYQQEQVEFPWQKGDVLMLDNMLVSHGRQSFSGTRKVVVAMAESFPAAQ